MIEVSLSQGAVALVDDIDAELVRRYSWQLLRSRSVSFHARTHAHKRDGKRHTVLMHRMILGDPILGEPDGAIDHINGDGLDNRRANLRFANHHQNGGNSRTRGGSSIYKGVSWKKEYGRWSAQIGEAGKTVYLGYFDDEVSAAIAYDAAARRVFGPFAALNFPGPGEQIAMRPLAVARG